MIPGAIYWANNIEHELELTLQSLSAVTHVTDHNTWNHAITRYQEFKTELHNYRVRTCKLQGVYYLKFRIKWEYIESKHTNDQELKAFYETINIIVYFITIYRLTMHKIIFQFLSYINLLSGLLIIIDESVVMAPWQERTEIAVSMIFHTDRRGIGISFQLAITPTLYSIIV